jgi:hypothetical protein
MSTPPGAVTPYQPGEVIQPTRVSTRSDRADTIVHTFVTIVEALVRNSPAFKSEEEVLTALRNLSDYRKHVVSGPLSSVVQEGEIAPVEDVSLREPPGGRAAPAPSQPYANLDYRELARAMLAVQQEQSTVHSITDVPDAPSGQPYSS